MNTLLLTLMFSNAVADAFIPVALPTRFSCASKMLLHGPDGPPPDDGYEFEDDSEGGNVFGKLGLTLLIAAVVSGTVYGLAEGETKNNAGTATLYLGSSGAALFTLDLIF